MAFNCSTCLSAVARPTWAPWPFLPTKGVESHKKFCADRSAPHYAAQGEHSNSIAHNVRTVYLGLPHFHLHSHHQKRHRKLITCTFETLLLTLLGVMIRKSLEMLRVQNSKHLLETLGHSFKYYEKSRAPQRTKKLCRHISSKNQILLLLGNFTCESHSAFSVVSKISTQKKN